MDANKTLEFVREFPFLFTFMLVVVVLIFEPKQEKILMIYRCVFASSTFIFFVVYFVGWFGFFDRYIDGASARVGSYGISSFVLGLFHSKILSKNANWVINK